MAQNIAYQIGSEQGITFSSKIGQGSTFSFEIINQRPDSDDSDIPDCDENLMQEIVLEDKLDKYSSSIKQPSLGSQLSTQKNTDCSCNRILVVDDVGTNIFAIQCLLNLFGLESDSATNGKMALDLIDSRVQHESPCCPGCKSKEKGYELIFMDINMPVMDGHEAMRNIRERMEKGVYPQMKVVAQTAYEIEVEIQKIYEDGFNDCLIKPLTMKKVQKTLKRYLGISQRK